MAKSTTKQNFTRQEILDTLKELTTKLNQMRHQRSREHYGHQKSMAGFRNLNLPDSGGSIDVYALSMQIEGMVKFAIALGALPPETEPTDYLQ